MLKIISKFFDFRKKSGRKYEQGYTLTELAISTSIIAILAVGSLKILGKKNDAESIRITNYNIKIVEDAIKEFIITNKFIPCPSLPNLKESDKDFGYSENIYNTDTMKCSNKNIKNETGAVPVRTLKIADKYSYDGWGRKLTYRTASSSGRKEDFYGFSFQGNINVTDLRGNKKTKSDESKTSNEGALFIIISHGANGKEVAWRKNFDYPDNALNLAYENNDNSDNAPVLPKGIEVQNADHEKNIYIQDNNTKYFDDIVYFATNKDILPVRLVNINIVPEESSCSDARFVYESGENLFKDFINKDPQEYEAKSKKILKAAGIASYMCENSKGYINFKKPNDITGLSLWLDSSDNNNVFSNSSCSEKASSNDNIKCWKDKSSNEINLTNSSSNTPVFKKNMINGLSAIEFAGNSSFVTSSSQINAKKLFSYDDTGTTIFIVQRYLPDIGENTENTRYYFSWGGSQAKDQIGFFVKEPQENLALQYAIDSGYEVYTSPSSESNKQFTSSWNIISISKDNDLKERVYINGFLIHEYEPYQVNSSYLTSGYKLTIGSHNTMQKYFTGNIGEIIMYNNYLNTKKREEIEYYLSDKWNIVLNNKSYNPCPYGKEFQQTTTNPTGACYCPDGYINIEKLDSQSGCIVNIESASECVKLKEISVNNIETISNAGISLWVDPNDCKSIKVNGQKIEEIKDQSPNENNPKQTTANKQPELVDSEINGNSIMRFSRNSKQNLDISGNIDIPSDEDRTIFLVIKPTSENTGENNIIGNGTGNSIAISNEKLILKYSSGSGTFTDDRKILKNNTSHLITARSLSQSTEIWIDGIKAVDEKDQNYLGWNIDRNLELGGISGSSSNDFFDGDIAEVIIYEYALNFEDREKTEKYLSNKWNIFSGVKNIEGLSLWLDASTLPYNNLDNIHTWIDQSGNKLNAKATGKNRPIFLKDDNNRASVYFNGTDNFMTLENNSLSEEKGSLFFALKMEDYNSNIVLYANDNNSFNDIFDGYCTNSDNLEIHFSLNKNSQQFVYQNGISPENCNISGNTYSNLSDINKDLIISVLYAEDENAVIYVNGTKEAEIDKIKSNGDLNIQKILLGSYANNSSNKFKGYLYEVILFNKNLYSNERLNIEEYLSRKWDIPLYE